MPDPARVLRRRRSPLTLGLGGVLVALVVVVELLIFDAYADVNRTTAIFSEQSFLNSSLINAQREAVLLEDQIEELSRTGDLKGVTVRRGLLANQLHQVEGQRLGDPEVAETIEQAHGDLALIENTLDRLRANPSRSSVRSGVAAMQPAAHRLAVNIKQLLTPRSRGCSGPSPGP